MAVKMHLSSPNQQIYALVSAFLSGHVVAGKVPTMERHVVCKCDDVVFIDNSQRLFASHLNWRASSPSRRSLTVSTAQMGNPYPNSITPTRTRIGWIGIGVICAAMASRLISAGYFLTIYARRPSKSLPLQSQGARLANSPAEVAQSSDVVFTMVGRPPDVRSVVLDTNGVLSGLSPNSVAVDMTNSHPDLAKDIFSAARSKGCWSVDAPVSGGDIGGRDGKLAIFAAGELPVVKWLEPLFEILGKVTYMGQAGCGQSCKIANQITISANLNGLSEGLVFAERAGLDVKKFLDAIRDGSASSKAMELFGERMIRREWGGGFVGYMVKDLGMGVDVVEKAEDDKVVVLPGASLRKQLFSSMEAIGNGDLGPQGVITVIERINGK